MMTTEELQQLATLIEKAKSMLTTPSGDSPSMVYFDSEGKLVGVTHWGCAPTEDYFRLAVVVQKEQKVKIN